MPTNVRRIDAPVPFFHASPIPDHCVNRSGRLVEHLGAAGEATVIYNDGGIYHRNAASVTFRQERLSEAELSDLLRAFQAADFDGIRDPAARSRALSASVAARCVARSSRLA